MCSILDVIICGSSDVEEVHDWLNDEVGFSSLLALWLIEVLVLLSPFSAIVVVSSGEVASSVLLVSIAQRCKRDLVRVFEVKLLHYCFNFLCY